MNGNSCWNYAVTSDKVIFLTGVKLFIYWSMTMILGGKRILKYLNWLILILFFISPVSTINALEFPSLKSLGLPSFKYGKLKRDRDVNRTFKTYRILPDHQYYTTGRGDIPYAIIGIDKVYELRPGTWQEIDLTTPLLRSWVSQMDNIYGYPPYGSLILDNNGERIGVWYSSKQWTTVIIEENNEIAVLAPEIPGFRGGR
jgi:hypothetical protein